MSDTQNKDEEIIEHLELLMNLENLKAMKDDFDTVLNLDQLKSENVKKNDDKSEQKKR